MKEILAEPGAKLHLYGKTEPKPAARWAMSRGSRRSGSER